jgi:hypothetical protein
VDAVSIQREVRTSAVRALAIIVSYERWHRFSHYDMLTNQHSVMAIKFSSDELGHSASASDGEVFTPPPGGLSSWDPASWPAASRPASWPAVAVSASVVSAAPAWSARVGEVVASSRAAGAASVVLLSSGGAAPSAASQDLVSLPPAPASDKRRSAVRGGEWSTTQLSRLLQYIVAD